MDYKQIASTIIDLKNSDLELRERLIEKGRLGEGYDEEMAAMHTRNAHILNEIIDRIGYPTIELVGNEGSEAAWLVIQHSIGNPPFMRKCLKLLEKAADNHEADRVQLAYLTDRIAVYENKPQLYGTQFDWDINGEMSPHPVDDLESVNQRRKLLGLMPLEDQITAMRTRIKTERQSPPTNFEQRQLEIAQWKNAVGWLP